MKYKKNLPGLHSFLSKTIIQCKVKDREADSRNPGLVILKNGLILKTGIVLKNGIDLNNEITLKIGTKSKNSFYEPATAADLSVV